MAQSTQAEATNFFANYKEEQKLGELLMLSLPTLADIKMVFNDTFANLYYKEIKVLDSMTKNTPPPSNDTIVYADVRVDTFLSEDVFAGKGNYAGGMNTIAEFLLPNITFYKLNMLRVVGAQYGVAFNYFVNLHNKWLFFPKPWHALRK